MRKYKSRWLNSNVVFTGRPTKNAYEYQFRFPWGITKEVIVVADNLNQANDAARLAYKARRQRVIASRISKG